MVRILVIDDQELVRASIRATLEWKGHQVLEAENGAVGIDLQKKHSFDLVITDIFMPVKEGIETILDLKRDFEDIKIVAISGGGGQPDVDYLEDAKTLGADKTLHKPFSNEELLDCVDECFQT